MDQELFEELSRNNPHEAMRQLAEEMRQMRKELEALRKEAAAKPVKKPAIKKAA